MVLREPRRDETAARMSDDVRVSYAQRLEESPRVLEHVLDPELVRRVVGVALADAIEGVHVEVVRQLRKIQAPTVE